MTEPWVVVLRCGDRDDDTYVYGPLADKETASRFADFLTTEVDPARAYPLGSPIPELLLFWNRQRTTPDRPKPGPFRPATWPPKPGEVWQDSVGYRWICTPTGSDNSYLTCLAKRADDGADEIWRLFGPLTLIMTVSTIDEEPPF